MMRRLILMRHAKSSWADGGQADIDRPLNKRGRNAAASIGVWLKARGYEPDVALVSSAARTRETWEIISGGIGLRPAEFLEALYLAGPEQILKALRNAPDVGVVLMLGHQPGLGEAAARFLTEQPNDPDFARHPTAATSVIDFEVDGWGDVDWGAGVLREFEIPRRLTG